MQKEPREVKDQEGWFVGMRATLRGLLGTDVEMSMRGSMLEDDIKEAHKEVANMSQKAKDLRKDLRDDDIEAVLLNLIKDL